MVKVLFVCTGNICRSPTAEAVFRSMAEQAGLNGRIEADSAGVAGYHLGAPPDRRAAAAARGRGYELSEIRARAVEPEDFRTFDLLVAMDQGHYDILQNMCPPGLEDRVVMFMDFAPARPESEVPDPYYGGETGFQQVLDLVEAGSQGLLEHLRARLDG